MLENFVYFKSDTMYFFIMWEKKGRKVKIDHRSKFSNLSNWKEEA